MKYTVGQFRKRNVFQLNGTEKKDIALFYNGYEHLAQEFADFLNARELPAEIALEDEKPSFNAESFHDVTFAKPFVKAAPKAKRGRPKKA